MVTYTMTHSFPSLLIPPCPLLPCLIPPLTPCQPLLLSCLSRPLALPLPCLPYLLPWHRVHDGGGNDDDLCRYVVLVCVFAGVCLCPCVCAQVWMVCSLLVSLI